MFRDASFFFVNKDDFHDVDGFKNTPFAPENILRCFSSFIFFIWHSFSCFPPTHSCKVNLTIVDFLVAFLRCTVLSACGSGCIWNILNMTLCRSEIDLSGIGTQL